MSENNPVLYLVGIGPGDPELMTIKASRLIKDCDVIFVPAKKKDVKKSNALDIIEKVVEIAGKKIVFLHFPMVKGEANMWPYFETAAEDVKKNLLKGQSGVFITIGCSTVYSTPGNLYRVLCGGDIDIRFVPGVSSINASAAAVGQPLVYSEESLVVLPATYTAEQIETFVESFDKLFLMKAHSSLDLIVKTLREKGLGDSSYLVEKATNKDERITRISDISPGYRPNYMSSVIVGRKK